MPSDIYSDGGCGSTRDAHGARPLTSSRTRPVRAPRTTSAADPEQDIVLERRVYVSNFDEAS